MKRTIMALTLGFAAGAFHAQAAPLQWTLFGVQFADGGAASGSFDFDAATTTYSDSDITTTAGTSFAGGTYTALAPGYASRANGAYFVTGATTDYTGTPLFGLNLLYSMTDLGGALPVKASPEYMCLDATCQTANLLRVTTGGYVTSIPLGQAVPEPASLALLGAALVGLTSLRRRAA